jgi:hypothetical protein
MQSKLFLGQPAALGQPRSRDRLSQDEKYRDSVNGVAQDLTDTNGQPARALKAELRGQLLFQIEIAVL